MRTLNFIIEGLSIRKDPQCDFSGIVPGTKGYLRATFKFDSDWSGCEKMVVFSRFGIERIPIRVINNSCEIPSDVLLRRSFKLKIIGVKPGLRLVTNNLEVKQDG